MKTFSFHTAVHGVDQVQFIAQSIALPAQPLVATKALYKLQGIFININHISVYRSCCLALPNCSSSLHIDVIICIHMYTIKIISKADTIVLIIVRVLYHVS